jgi:predicted DNA-binding transcriptional regulator AlpA
MSVTALINRIEELEREVKLLKTFMEENVKVSQFLPVSKAALVLGVCTATIYDRIKHAKAFPKESLFKRGIHWEEYEIASKTPGKDPSIRYRVNPVEWRKIS